MKLESSPEIELKKQSLHEVNVIVLKKIEFN